MIKFTILCLAALAFVAGVQSDCGKDEIQRFYDNFNQFRHKYVLKLADKYIQNYDYTVTGDVYKLHVTISGQSFTENYKKSGDKIETIDGQLTSSGQKTSTQFKKVGDKYEIVFNTPVSKAEFTVDSLDVVDFDKFEGLEKAGISELIPNRKASFEFFNSLAEEDVKRVKSFEYIGSGEHDEKFGKAVYQEFGSESSLLVYREGETYIGSFTCDGGKYKFNVVSDKIEDVTSA